MSPTASRSDSTPARCPCPRRFVEIPARAAFISSIDGLILVDGAGNHSWERMAHYLSIDEARSAPMMPGTIVLDRIAISLRLWTGCMEAAKTIALDTRSGPNSAEGRAAVFSHTTRGLRQMRCTAPCGVRACVHAGAPEQDLVPWRPGRAVDHGRRGERLTPPGVAAGKRRRGRPPESRKHPSRRRCVRSEKRGGAAAHRKNGLSAMRTALKQNCSVQVTATRFSDRRALDCVPSPTLHRVLAWRSRSS